jgi:hypothetical protein
MNDLNLTHPTTTHPQHEGPGSEGKKGTIASPHRHSGTLRERKSKWKEGIITPLTLIDQP